MRSLFVIALLALLVLPTAASAEVQTFTATHTYILGDHDSKDDARQRCLLEAKRKVLEQAGVLIESASEVKDFALAKDKITSFTAAVLQVKETKEDFGFENGHNKLTLTVKANVDLAEVRKQLAARQVDKGRREEMAAQQEGLKRLEVQLEAMQRQQQSQITGQISALPSSDSALELQRLHMQAGQGDSTAQTKLGLLYARGQGVSKDYTQARQWYEKAAEQGSAEAQLQLGWLYFVGLGVSMDSMKAYQWYLQAAIKGNARAQFALGLLYLSGDGVPQNEKKGVEWIRKATNSGSDLMAT